MKKYISIIIGCLLIGLAYNEFFVPYDFIPSGLIGLGSVFENTYHINAVFFIAAVNLFLILVSTPILKIKNTKKYLLPAFFIPLFIYLTQNINTIISINNLDPILIALTGSLVCGYGYSIIYDSSSSANSFDIVEEMTNKNKVYKTKVLTFIIDIFVVILAYLNYGADIAIYSTLIILVISYFSTKSKLGINSNKTFFIITSKIDDIKNYLINDLKYDYTEFNIKGGFTNQKNKIIMTVIETKDYYRLKEGISLIDPTAFISIIDNYESINKNVKINKILLDSNKKD